MMESWKKTFYASWVAQLCSIMGFQFIFPIMSLYVRELGIQDKGKIELWSGIVGGAAGLTMAIFSPIWGILADRYGRKMMVLRSMFGGAAVLVLMAYARNVGDLIVLRLIQGALTGTATASIALVASVTPPAHSGFALGMMQAAVFIGGSIGALVGGQVAQWVGFRPALIIAGAMVFAAGLIVRYLVHEDFHPPPRLQKKGSGLKAFGEVIGTAGFIAALLALFQVHFANSAFQPVFPLFVEDIMRTEEGVRAVTGRVIGVAGLAAALGAGLFGQFSDELGHRRVLIISTLAAGIVTLPLAFANNLFQLYAMRILFGLAAAGIMPSANAIIRGVSQEKHLAKAFGITASVSCIGWGLGPLIGGFMADQVGIMTGSPRIGTRAPFILTAVVLMLTTVLVVLRVKERNMISPGPPDG